MVKATIDIPEHQNRVLNVVKGKYGLKNKAEALAFILGEYEKQLEPEARPEYLKKLGKIEKEGYGETFSSIEELRNKIETQ
jgi:hypothetical protein